VFAVTNRADVGTGECTAGASVVTSTTVFAADPLAEWVKDLLRAHRKGDPLFGLSRESACGDSDLILSGEQVRCYVEAMPSSGNAVVFGTSDVATWGEISTAVATKLSSPTKFTTTRHRLYIAANLLPGEYQVTVSASGFATEPKRGSPYGGRAAGL